MKRSILLLLIVVFACSMTFIGIGCKEEAVEEEAVEDEAVEEEVVEEEVVAEDDLTFIMVTHSAPTNTFWGAVYNGWTEACRLLGVNGEYVGSTKADDPTEERGNLEVAVSASPDGIASGLSNYIMLEEPLRDAVSKGIPVVALNVRDPRPDDERIPYLVYVGEDSYEMGVVEAKGVIEKFVEIYDRPPKRAIFLNHAVGVLCLTDRGQGAQDISLELGVANFEVVPTEGDPSKIAETVRSYIEKHPDTEAIFTGWSQVSVWSVQALREVERLGNVYEPAKEGNVFVGGIDVDAECLQLILDGDVVLTVDQQPYLQGFYSAMVLYNWVKYKLSPFGAVYTGPLTIDPSNAEEMIDLAKQGIRG